METIYIVTLSIFNANNELVLVRKKGSKFFQLPGGKKMEMEDDYAVLQRELYEELQFEVVEKDIHFMGEHQAVAVNESNTRVVGRMYVLDTTFDIRLKNDNEIEEFIWVNPSNYKSITWANLVKEFVFPIWANRNKSILE